MYRSQGVDRTNIAKGAPGTQQIGLCINCYHAGEQSDWAAFLFIVYNRELNTSEIIAVEDYISSTYAIPLRRPAQPPVMSGMVSWYSGGSFEEEHAVWYDMSGNHNHAVVSIASPSTLNWTAWRAQPAYGDDNFVNGQFVFRGTPPGIVTFPPGAMPVVFTLFHVTRYAGIQRKRILTAKVNDPLDFK